jgi:hypothetical protein
MAVHQGSSTSVSKYDINFFRELPPLPEIQEIEPRLLQQKIVEVARSAFQEDPYKGFMYHTEEAIREKGGIILTRDRSADPTHQYRGIVALPLASNEVLLCVCAGGGMARFTRRNLDELLTEAIGTLVLKKLPITGISKNMGRNPQLTLPAFNAWREAQITLLSQ